MIARCVIKMEDCKRFLDHFVCTFVQPPIFLPLYYSLILQLIDISLYLTLGVIVCRTSVDPMIEGCQIKSNQKFRIAATPYMHHPHCHRSTERTAGTIHKAANSKVSV